MTTQATQQAAGDTKQADSAPGGNQQQNSAPGATPQWIVDAIKDEARQKELVKFSRTLFDEDFATHKEAASKRERELNSKLSASDYWKSLDEEGREAVRESKTLRDDAVETWAERGVPKKLLEKFSTPKAVREFAREYLDAGGSTGAKASAGAGDDLESRIASRVLAAISGQNGNKGPEALPKGNSSSTTSQNDKDFVRAFADGDLPATPENIKRAQTIAMSKGVRV